MGVVYAADRASVLKVDENSFYCLQSEHTPDNSMSMLLCKASSNLLHQGTSGQQQTDSENISTAMLTETTATHNSPLSWPLLRASCTSSHAQTNGHPKQRMQPKFSKVRIQIDNAKILNRCY